MIKIRIRDADNEIDIQFPISESALSAKLTGIRIAEDSTSPPFAFVSEVYWSKEFSMLTGRTVNLDELNYSTTASHSCAKTVCRYHLHSNFQPDVSMIR